MPQQTTTIYRPTPTNPTAAVPAADTTLVDETADLLDEIDAVLEANALETVRTYVQRGGQ